MAVPKVILDASFVVNMIGLNPNRVDFTDFDEIISESDRIAPNLLEYEMGSAITIYRKVGGQKDLQIFWDQFWLLDLQLAPMPNPKFVHKLAQQHRLSFYDACYLALLDTESADFFLTLDKKDFKPVSKFDRRVRVFG